MSQASQDIYNSLLREAKRDRETNQAVEQALSCTWQAAVKSGGDERSLAVQTHRQVSALLLPLLAKDTQ